VRRWRANADPRIRSLERKAKESGDPEAMSQWFWARQRAGGRDAFEAAREESDWLWNVERPRIEADYKKEGEANRAEAMKVLRSLHKRIKRSKRKDLYSLRDWARSVVGSQVVDEALAPTREENERINDYWKGVADQVLERRKVLGESLRDHALAPPISPGPEELEFRFHRTSTFSTQGYGADRYARLGAEGDVSYLTYMGFEARMERDSGEEGDLIPGPFPGTSRGRSRYNEGWRSLVKVRGPLDVEVLRARQEAWKDRDWDGYMVTVLGHPSEHRPGSFPRPIP
jgi:hypothetical protein